MKKDLMSTGNYMAKVFETLFTIPGMHDNVKVELRVPRRNVLLLSKVIERGLHLPVTKEEDGSILDFVPQETKTELQEVAVELLKKAGLTEMNEKLKSF
jgi:hypothetical protein